MDNFLVGDFCTKHVEDVLNKFLESGDFNGILGIEYENLGAPTCSGMIRMMKSSKLSVTRLVAGIALTLTMDVLPHIRLIERYDAKINGVYLHFIFSAKRMPKFDVEEHRERIHQDIQGYTFDLIFKNCPRIESLEWFGASLTNCGPDLAVCKSLQVLKFGHCLILPKFFKSLSRRIPSLVLLSANYCVNTNDTGHLVVYMVHTTVNTLLWMQSGGGTISDFHYSKICI